MTIFNKLGKKFNCLAKNAVQKSSEVMEITKLNLNINTEEEALNDLFDKLGKYCFEKYTKGDISDSTVTEICEDIKIHQENIGYFREKINEVKNVVICVSCGKENPKTNEVCSKCDKSLVGKDEIIEVVKNETEQNENETGASENQ
jgi:ribosomal protein L40E